MKPRELLMEFLKFHYKQNPLRKQKTNEKDVDDFLAELPADIEVKNVSSNPVVVRPVCTCPNSEELIENSGGTPRCKWCGKDMDPNAL